MVAKKKLNYTYSITPLRIVGVNRETVTASFKILVLHVYFTYNIIYYICTNSVKKQHVQMIHALYYFHTGHRVYGILYRQTGQIPNFKVF